ncbi:hypothetical protein LAZ67_7002727 [Cordylochernes scorpioides]|uniref:Transposase n=1 Tax=Cordylochernes scorpioides TaxID=51811 RepID=A0ABY6KNU8_9ARAC|nr:hypothetical protein LAZ67_7002727 [Cordylochernes scorpioides]
MSRRRVFEWYKRFKEGREETTDNERSGRPSISTTPEKVNKVLELDILGVRRLNAVLVPKDLTFDQKNARKETASLNLEATTDDPELPKRVITGDETWIYGFDSEINQLASEWRFKNEPRPKKARKAPSKVKVMLTMSFEAIEGRNQVETAGAVEEQPANWSCNFTSATTFLALVREAFNIIGRPPQFKAWIFETGQEDDERAILSSAKCRIYRYFKQVGLGVGIEDPLIAWKRTLVRSTPGYIGIGNSCQGRKKDKREEKNEAPWCAPSKLLSQEVGLLLTADAGVLPGRF